MSPPRRVSTSSSSRRTVPRSWRRSDRPSGSSPHRGTRPPVSGCSRASTWSTSAPTACGWPTASCVPADVVLAAVGARPTTDWLAGALPRETDGSLRVDEHHAVIGAPRSVRAVGDVAVRRSHGTAGSPAATGTVRCAGRPRWSPTCWASRTRPRWTSRRTSSPPSWAMSSRCSATRAPTTRSSCEGTRPTDERLGRAVVPAGVRRGRGDPHGRPPARRRRRPAPVHRPRPAAPRPHGRAGPERPATSPLSARTGRVPPGAVQCAKWRVPVR